MKKKLEDIEPVDEHHGLLLKMMKREGITQTMLVKETGVKKATAHRYVHYGFDADFWAKLQGPYGAKFRYIKKLEADQSNKYTYQAFSDEQEERWEEQKELNKELRIENAQLKTRIESLEERVELLEKKLGLKDSLPGENEIPSSDDIPNDPPSDEDLPND
ncbi:MAG TPA: hypothetical protein VGM30_10155 [Puia sp.]